MPKKRLSINISNYHHKFRNKRKHLHQKKKEKTDPKRDLYLKNKSETTSETSNFTDSDSPSCLACKDILLTHDLIKLYHDKITISKDTNECVIENGVLIIPELEVKIIIKNHTDDPDTFCSLINVIYDMDVFDEFLETLKLSIYDNLLCLISGLDKYSEKQLLSVEPEEYFRYNGVFHGPDNEPIIEVQNVIKQTIDSIYRIMDTIKIFRICVVYSMILEEYHKYFHAILTILESKIDLLCNDDMIRIVSWSKDYKSFLSETILYEPDLSIDPIIILFTDKLMEKTDSNFSEWIINAVNLDIQFNNPECIDDINGVYYSASIGFLFKFLNITHDRFAHLYDYLYVKLLNYISLYQCKILDNIVHQKIAFEHIIAYINTSIKCIELFDQCILKFSSVKTNRCPTFGLKSGLTFSSVGTESLRGMDSHQVPAENISSVNEGFINIFESALEKLAQAIVFDFQDITNKSICALDTNYCDIVVQTIDDYIVNDIRPHIINLVYNQHNKFLQVKFTNHDFHSFFEMMLKRNCYCVLKRYIVSKTSNCTPELLNNLKSQLYG